MKRARPTRRAKIPALLLALALSLTTVTPALAAPATAHMTVTKPGNKSVYYVGESIPVAATFKKYELGPQYSEVSDYTLLLWTKHLTVWNQELVDNPDDPDNPSALFSKGNTYSCKMSIPTAELKPGAYCLQFGFFGHLSDLPVQTAAPAEEPEDVDEWIELDLTLKQLKPPAGLRAAAGVKKVTVSWKKADGAKQYEVQRKGPGEKKYTRVATLTGLKFVDKKVKAGKKYTYRIRTLRGSLKSGWSAAKQSGKVLKASKKAPGAVYCTPSGKCYHRKGCATLKRSKKVYKTTVKKAKAKKLKACKVCKP